MAKTNWQDPGSGEIRSTHISGLQEAVGKIEESIGIEAVTETDIPLTEVFISNDDRCRIYQSPEGKRNWLSSPAPIIRKNGIVITDDFEIDYGGGAVILTTPISETDILTADISYTAKIVGKQLSSEDYSSPEKEKLSGIETGANKYIHPESHPASMISLNDASNVEDSIAGIKENIASHQSDYTNHVTPLGITSNVDNAYSITSSKIITDGSKFSLKFNVAATGTATLNISSEDTPRRLIKPGGADFKPKAGTYLFIRDAENFQYLGEGGDYGTAEAAQVLSPYTIGTELGLISGSMVDHSSTNIQCTFASDVNITQGYYNGSGKVLRPGFTAGYTTQLFRDNTNLYQTTSSTYVKMLEKTLFIGGTYRIDFALRSGTSGQNAFARIYRNGIAVGIERYTSYTSVTSFTEDISGWSSGDKIQLYMRGSGSNYSVIDTANGGIGISINEKFII